MKKILPILALIPLFFTLSAYALRSEKALSSAFKGDQWVATLAPGYHFNTKAPNQIQIKNKMFLPAALEARTASFAKPGETWDGAKAVLYVCDDEVTFCETHEVAIAGKKVANEWLRVKSPAGKKPMGKKGGKDEHGFLLNDYAGALAQAKKQKKLVLIDFAARWCPGCQRLEADVFSRKEFTAESKNYVKVKLDVDLFENSVVADKYKILGVPTVVIVNAAEEEILRLLDYQSPEAFSAALAEVKADPTPMNALAAKLGPGEESSAARAKLGMRQFVGGLFADAEKTWSAMKAPPAEYASARFYAAQEDLRAKKIDEAKYASLLRELLKSESDSVRALAWRNELAQLESVPAKEKAELGKSGVAVADALLADEARMKKAFDGDLRGDMVGYEKFVVATTKAELISNSGASETDQRAAWCAAADTGDALNISPKALGPSLRHLSLVIECKRWERADEILQKLVKNFPENGDLLRRRLRVLVELKKYPEAIEVGEKSLKDSYGRNEFWVVEQLAKAYKGAGQIDKARALVVNYLARPEIEYDKMKGTKESLKKIAADLEAPAKATN